MARRTSGSLTGLGCRRLEVASLNSSTCEREPAPQGSRPAGTDIAPLMPARFATANPAWDRHSCLSPRPAQGASGTGTLACREDRRRARLRAGRSACATSSAGAPHFLLDKSRNIGYNHLVTWQEVRPCQIRYVAKSCRVLVRPPWLRIPSAVSVNKSWNQAKRGDARG